MLVNQTLEIIAIINLPQQLLVQKSFVGNKRNKLTYIAKSSTHTPLPVLRPSQQAKPKNNEVSSIKDFKPTPSPLNSQEGEKGRVKEQIEGTRQAEKMLLN